jgi:hypothetical protein
VSVWDGWIGGRQPWERMTEDVEINMRSQADPGTTTTFGGDTLPRPGQATLREPLIVRTPKERLK